MKKKKILLLFRRGRNSGQRTGTPCLDVRLCLARIRSRFLKAIKGYSMLPKAIQGVLKKVFFFTTTFQRGTNYGLFRPIPNPLPSPLALSSFSPAEPSSFATIFQTLPAKAGPKPADSSLCKVKIILIVMLILILKAGILWDSALLWSLDVPSRRSPPFLLLFKRTCA